MKKSMVVFMMLCVLAGVVYATPYMSAIPADDWQDLLTPPGPFMNNLNPLTPPEGSDYSVLWSAYLLEGDPYPPTIWVQPELYVYDGDGMPGNDYPDEPGLVMAWDADDTPPDENYSAAWQLEYGLDPDLTNCTINISVFPPPWINTVSFWLMDINGNQVAWNWNVPAKLPWNLSTAIKIDTSKLAQMTSATLPTASGFASGPGVFDITKVVSFGVSENAFQYPGLTIPPGGTAVTNQAWNAWSNLWVINNATKAYKGIWTKFSQPPMIMNEGQIPPQIDGWDVQSVFPENFENSVQFSMAADDWVCKDERPVTDVHWWGSFVGWTQPYLPPRVPDYFLMCIWRNVPASADGTIPSHPLELLWTHKCYKWVWNFAGYDVDPRAEFVEDGVFQYDSGLLGIPQESETCFQFNQLLSEDDWFYQEPMEDPEIGNVYWLSIAAVYENLQQGEVIEYPWGWKTKPFDPEKAPDAAVVITQLDSGTPPWNTFFNPGSGGHVTMVMNYYPIVLPYPLQYPQDKWFDLAFELTTNAKEPDKCYDLDGDINHDCDVNLTDFSILAGDWLKTSTP